jgi:hypothetical protein
VVQRANATHCTTAGGGHYIKRKRVWIRGYEGIVGYLEKGRRRVSFERERKKEVFAILLSFI